jgi:prolipoprotein diacylglyceryltransferase
MADAIAPALMIAYAIGRIGCQVAGDGDWGIYNSAFAVDDNSVITQTTQPFDKSILAHPDFFSAHYRNVSEVPHKNFPKPGALSFLPDWLFAYDYPHNVNEVGVRLNNCDEPKYCNHLPAPVFPTPFYETLMGTALFFMLWGLRKRLKVPGTLFALYLIVNGVERFLIEQIRVNNKMDFFGLQPTQAEVIAAAIVVAGIGIWIFLNKKYRTSPK